VKAPEIACFGEVLWDLYETKPGVFARRLGGASANTAVVLARLGVRALLVGGVGQDPLGDDLLRALTEARVDVSGVSRHPRRTGIVFVMRGRFVPYRSGTADAAVSAKDVPRACGAAAWGVLGSSSLVGPELAGGAARFMDLVTRGGGRLAVDLNVRPHLWPSADAMRARAARIAHRAALVKASHTDLEKLAGSEKAGLAWLAREAPRAVVLVTRAARPASAFGPHGRVDVRAHKVRCVDPSGGGDAFLAGALAVLADAGPAWTEPEVLTRALRIGHRLGASAVRRVGATDGTLGVVEKIVWRKTRNPP
jgi:fructokinase